MNWRDSIWVQDSVTRRRSQSGKLRSVELPMKGNTGKGNVHPQLVLKTTAGLFKHVYIHILILLGSFQPENYFSLFFKTSIDHYGMRLYEFCHT